MIDILDYIPYGTKEKPITREELVRLTGLSDREVRVLIQKAKEEKFAIVNVGEGYYVPNNPDDLGLREYTHREQAKAFQILRGLKGHRILLGIDLNQEVLDL